MKRLTTTLLIALFSLLGISTADAQSKEFMAIYNYANSNLVSKPHYKTSQIPGVLIAQSVTKNEDRILAHKIDVIYQILVDGHVYNDGQRVTFHKDINDAIEADWTLTEPHFSLSDVYEMRMDITLNNANYKIFSRDLGNNKTEHLVYIHNTKSYDSNLTCIVGRLTLSDITKMIVKE